MRCALTNLYPPPCGEGGHRKSDDRVGTFSSPNQDTLQEIPPPLTPPHKGEGKASPYSEVKQ